MQVNTMSKRNLPCVQVRGLATRTCPPNIRQHDHPPAKKSRTLPTPEFHIAVNVAPTPGAGSSALQATCVVSDSPILPPGSASTPGPLRLGQVTSLAGSCSAPDPQTVGRKVYIPKARRILLKILSESARTGRAPSAYDVLTWMDAEYPNSLVSGCYMKSYSDFQTFGIEDAFDIMENEVFFLATFGQLGHYGATHLRHNTENNILAPLGLWATKSETSSSVGQPLDRPKILKWRDEVEQGHVEDVEDSSVKVEVVEAEEVEEGDSGYSSGIEEIEGWSEVNVEEQWEDDLYEV